MKHLVLTAALLFGATALQAGVFSFTYSGAGLGGQVTASGILNATASPGNSGIYNVTSVASGTRNGSKILSGTGSFYFGSSPNPFLGSVGGLSFNVGGVTDSLLYAGPLYLETFNGNQLSFGNFSISAVSVPEPSTLLILLSMGAVFWVLARKLRVKDNR